ncbi:CBS domain-containing protein CBSX1, chloroplastic-like [Impatiens glandulifera]|uniref:CBS domain-containing protein CBSX1, chloroplastic-like n=1 Tax=Impatiens glandulifera TaxID=253017 RepID=UPI001FB05AF1|nr:CBS domain-containing protein CBSX1, chloroplastic-like [Impatiens glandulifera]
MAAISISIPSTSLLLLTAFSAPFNRRQLLYNDAHRTTSRLQSTRADYRSCCGRPLQFRNSVSAVLPCSTNSSTTTAGTWTVGDFMTRKAHLLVVKPTTTVDQALEILVEKRITGLPVIDDDWKLVGVVSDYDLLALDTISGGAVHADSDMFPDVNSTWKVFNEIQNLLSKTNGKVVGDLMTPAPLVVHEETDLFEAVRLLLETRHRRLPVVDNEGRLVGVLTRGDVVRAALKIKWAADDDHHHQSSSF